MLGDGCRVRLGLLHLQLIKSQSTGKHKVLNVLERKNNMVQIERVLSMAQTLLFSV